VKLRMALSLVGAFAGLLSFASIAPASADTSITLYPPRIAVEGQTVTATVMNTGSVAYVVKPAADVAWLTVPKEFELAPGEEREVLIQVTGKADRPDTVVRFVIPPPKGSVSGITAAGGVGLVLDFYPFQRPAPPPEEIQTGAPPWWPWVLAGGVALAVGYFVIRRRRKRQPRAFGF